MNVLKLQNSQTNHMESIEREGEESPLSLKDMKQFVNITQARSGIQLLTHNNRNLKVSQYFFKEAKVICAIFCLIILLLIGISIFVVPPQQSIQAVTKINMNKIENTKSAAETGNLEARSFKAELGQQISKDSQQYKQTSNNNIGLNITTEQSNEQLDQIVQISNREGKVVGSYKKVVQLQRQISERWAETFTNTIQQRNVRRGRYRYIKNTKNSKKNKKQQVNILANLTKNPYWPQSYANITKLDLRRALKWKTMTSYYYNASCTSAVQELKYYEQKYNIGNYTQLPFCLVVPTLNNRARRRAELNIKSIVMQNYSNYRIIVIDDGSADGTANIIQNFMKKQNKISPTNYKIIANKEREFALPNILNAAKNFCHPQDIFMVIDGDDELIGRQVLKLFNAVFQKQQIWFMYTNFISSKGTLGYSRPYPPEIIQNNTYRGYGFTATHLRAYYTQLLLNIKDEDLRNQNGSYFTAAGDMAIVMPCLEQAHQKVKYVPQITYLYNVNTGQNIHKKRINDQRMNNLKIRSKPRYEALTKLY